MDELRERMYDIAPHLENIDEIEPNTFNIYDDDIEPDRDNSYGTDSIVSIKNEPFEKYFTNYFATDPISRASLVLKKASKDLPNSTNSWL